MIPWFVGSSIEDCLTEYESCRSQLKTASQTTRHAVARIIPWIALSIAALTGPVLDAQVAPGKLRVSVADTVGMNKVSVDAGRPETEIAHFSPDSRKFVIVVRKGDLGHNSNVYSLLLWRSEEIFRSRAPKVILSMSSSSNRPAIQAVSWLSDNETLIFLGEHTGELQQLYSFNTRTRVLKQITHHRSSLLAYTITGDGEAVAFVAEEPPDSIWDNRSERNGVVLSNEKIYQILAGTRGGRMWGTAQLYYQSHGGIPRRIVAGDVPDALGSGLRLSPDGRYILFAPRMRTVPKVWTEYADRWIHHQAIQVLREGEWSWLTRYELVDTQSGKTKILLDGPRRGVLSQAVWAPDSHSVILSGVFLPFDGTSDNERKRRQTTPFCVEVGVPGGEISEISREDLQLEGWEKTSGNLVFCSHVSDLSQGACAKVYFRKREGMWERLTIPENASHAETDIVLEQGMNSPPKLFARYPGRSETLLLDLNPQFQLLRFAKEEAIHWQGRNGQDFKGGLYYPVDYVAGQKYPLVIQTHAFNKDKFWIDGPWTTAFAAQPLAAKGTMVLQADESHEDNDSPIEVDREVGRIESAIDYLDGQGLVDRNRIGIIGFSRTCLFVKYALTHSKYHFAAASVTDGVDGGYFQYLLSTYMTYIYEGVNGGLPWGPGLDSWRERSPGFRIDEVRTPLRIMAENPDIALFEWEWYAALRRLGRPVEMVVTNDGEHILQKPWERMVSQQGNVDWFVFWLQGKEDPDPSKADQYVRWRKLRSQAESQP